MMRSRPLVSAAAVGFATLLAVLGGGRDAAAQSLPGAGRYQCTNASGAVADLNFTVGPGEIYTTPRGWRGTMSIHPVSGNILFHGPTPQNSYQGRYEAGPPARIELVTVTDGVSKETGIACQMH